MTENDVKFFERCISSQLVCGKLLEVGSAKVQGLKNLCDLARDAGIQEVIGADLQPFDGVDVVVNFGESPSIFAEQWSLGKFSTVCVFNVLEHTFDPITVLRNALYCLKEGGHLLIVTPSIWPLHSYPGDFVRLLPDWYEEFGKSNGLTLLRENFCWLSEFGIQPINSKTDPCFPTYIAEGRNASKLRYWTSRIAHKAFNTYGRSHWANHSAIGAAFRA